MRLTVKLGGSILEDKGIRLSILGQISELRSAGHELILVHGGGKSLSARLGQLGIPSMFIQGFRVTDSRTLQVALMVLAGEVNKTIVMELGGLGVDALGLCGADVSAVRCEPLSDLPGCPRDLGWVGKPSRINKGFFDLLIGSGITPVVASIAVGEDFQAYNVNADQMAAICAWGTGSAELVYLTDVAGVLGRDQRLLSSLHRRDIGELRASGVLSGGMLPKTDACLEALDRGVPRVHILPGAAPRILCRHIEGNTSEGTRIHGND